MFSRSNLIFIAVVLGAMSCSSVFAEDSVGFRFVASPDTVKDFLRLFEERVETHHLLNTLCSKPDYLDPLEAGIIEYLPHGDSVRPWRDRIQDFRHKEKDTLIFVCDAKAAAFTEVGAVFLAATPPHSPRPDAELSAFTGPCPRKHCPADWATDCITYSGTCYHRGQYPSPAHKCVQD